MSFDLQPKILENALIAIIPLKESDFESLYTVASDPLIWELHPSKDRYKKEVFSKFFDEAIISKSAFSIIDLTTNEIIGSSRFYDLNTDYSSVAIGYTFLARKYWGGTYNKAIKKMLIDYALQFVSTVIFHVGTTNYRSQQAIIKIGGKKLNEIDFENIGEHTHFTYEIKKSDWLNFK